MGKELLSSGSTLPTKLSTVEEVLWGAINIAPSPDHRHPVSLSLESTSYLTLEGSAGSRLGTLHQVISNILAGIPDSVCKSLGILFRTLSN